MLNNREPSIDPCSTLAIFFNPVPQGIVYFTALVTRYYISLTGVA